MRKSPRAFGLKNSKGGQAALEFLMTYGWAILAVLVVISALAYFGVLNPVNYLPERCTLGAGFGCTDISVGANGAEILLQNKLPQSYVITAASITANGATCSAGINDITLGSGDSATLSIPNCNLAGIRGKKRVAINITYHDAGSSFSHSLRGDAITSVSGSSYFTSGHALQFDGVSNYLAVDNGSDFNLTGNSTIAAWVNASSMMSGSGVIIRWDGSTGFTLRVSNTGQLLYNYWNAVSAWHDVPDVGPLRAVPGQWSFVAIVIRIPQKKVDFYVDGKLSSTVDLPDAPGADTGNVVIGGMSYGQYFRGQMDELQVYNRALSASEIAALYNNGAGQYGYAAPDMVAGWHFDEGNGTTAVDFTGGNDAHFVSMGQSAWVRGKVNAP